jgi:hypothetical protein
MAFRAHSELGIGRNKHACTFGTCDGWQGFRRDGLIGRGTCVTIFVTVFGRVDVSTTPRGLTHTGLTVRSSSTRLGTGTGIHGLLLLVSSSSGCSGGGLGHGLGAGSAWGHVALQVIACFAHDVFALFGHKLVGT